MRLSKLHGLGNDFLVLLDDGSTGPVLADRVRELCHRRTGIGADGLIRSERVEAGEVTFELLNADGSGAEMSGNGARCLGLAAARSGWWEDRSRPLVLQTAVGERPVEWQGGELEQAWLRVAMGRVRPVHEDEPCWDGFLKPLRADGDGSTWSFRRVDVGNPHTVILINGTMPPREHLEEALTVDAEATLDHSNFEFVVRGPQVGALTLVVHERGAGWTRACGTGSVAAAWAAHEQGWVGRLVTVHNPGGQVQVDLTGPEARLTGPTAFVADVEVSDGSDRPGSRS